eukprot:2970142-Rhodomonas_salina.1
MNAVATLTVRDHDESECRLTGWPAAVSLRQPGSGRGRTGRTGRALAGAGIISEELCHGFITARRSASGHC